MTVNEPPVTEPTPVPEIPLGRLIAQYLQHTDDGASAKEIVNHLHEELNTDWTKLNKVVENVLENGMALGFLEKKGSHYMNWISCQIRKRKTRVRSSSRGRRHHRIRHYHCRCAPRRHRHHHE